MTFDITQVQTDQDIDDFHELPFRIYENYSQWAPAFRFEIENIFDPGHNPFFEKGECERYLVKDGQQVVGRFAVMNTPARDKVLEPTMGGLGFIEMENNADLAQQIIDFAKDWHSDRGYKAMRGPINFGENDTFWGLLVENYDEPPIYGMFYHPPYYKELLEQTGAKKLDDHWSYKRDFDNNRLLFLVIIILYSKLFLVTVNCIFPYLLVCLKLQVALIIVYDSQIIICKLMTHSYFYDAIFGFLGSCITNHLFLDTNPE